MVFESKYTFPRTPNPPFPSRTAVLLECPGCTDLDINEVSK